MYKSLPMLGVVLVLGLLIASAPRATALTITQTSNQNVGHPAFPANACVDVGGANTANGTIIGPFPCNNQLNEQWDYQNGEFLGIGTHDSVGKCLSVHGNSTASGAGIELDTCSATNTSQQWVISGNGTSSQIQNVRSGKCIDSLGQIGGGLQLVIEPCNSSAGQQWELK